MRSKGKVWGFVLGMLGLLLAAPCAFGFEVDVGQVVVTATKTEIDVSEAPQSITVISREEIAKSPDRSVAQILQRVAGVEVSQYGPQGSVSLAKIRGSEAGQVLILINGRRINDAQSGMFDLSNLPVGKEDIERIEVLRGGASALYGADAMGGVINIITKTPSAKPYTRVSTSLGRFGEQEYALAHRWQPGSFGYGLSLSKESSRGFRPNSAYDSWILGGEVGYDFNPNSQLKLSARTVQKEIGLSGSVDFPDLDDRQKDDSSQVDLGYRGKINSSLDLNVRGFQNVYRQTFLPGTEGFNVGAPVLHKNYATGGEVQASWSIGEAHLLTSGAEAIQDRVNSSTLGVHRATRGAFYLQDEIEVLKSLSTTLGLRYDTHSIYQDQLNPRVGVLWHLPAEVILRASVGRSYRAPTFNDLYWPEEAYTAGNPNLQPEKAWSYELGGEKRFGRFLNFKAAGFLRDVDDLILWAMGSDFKFRPSNIKSAKIWGVETEMTFTPYPGLTIPLNYTYLYPRDESTGDPIPAKEKHTLNAGVEYTWDFGLKTSLKGRYIQYYVSQTSKLNRDYLVLDAQVAYEWKISRGLSGEAFLSLKNALDREYQVTEGYPMAPRSLCGGLSLAF